MKILVHSVISLLAGACIGYFLTDIRRMRRSSATTERDTVTLLHIDTVFRRDTVYATIPTYSEAPAPRTVTLSRKAITHCDSDSLTLRAVTRVYSDSLFRAVISGVDPRLDSLTLIRPIPTVTRSVTTSIHTNPLGPTSGGHSSRWSLGITAGATLTSHGLIPGLTLGLTYRLWP